MSDDIFIKHGLGTFQQPYNARQPVIAQEPNIRTFQEPNIRNQQEPNIRSQQEPNIRNQQQPSTYNHRSPFTYNHRSPTTYNHRSPSIAQATYQSRQPNTYQHRSPSTYRHPVIYQHPGTYNHRSPFTYNHRSPFTYNHRSPFTYQARQPGTYNHRSPFTYQHRSPTTYQHRSPFTYQHASPYIASAQNPFIRNAQAPYIANSQTPTIGTSPIIYDAIDGDTTGPTSSTGWGPSHSSQPWSTAALFRSNSDDLLQAFAQMGFAYQHTTTTPMSGNTNAGTQGDVEVSWYAGTNASMATEYYDFIQLYDNGQTPTIDDTWAWDIRYEHKDNNGAYQTGYVSGYGTTHGSHTPNQAGGGGYTNGSWYAIYSGSSSAGSYNGTRNSRYFDWKAQTANYGGPDGTATAKSVWNNIWTIRITKNLQTTIYTQYTHSGVWCECTKGQIL